MANSTHFQFLLRRCFARASFSRPRPLPLLVPCSDIISSSISVCDRWLSSFSASDDLADLRERILLLTEKPRSPSINAELDEIRPLIHTLADELLNATHLSYFEDDIANLTAFLDSRSAASILRRSPSGLASVELLIRLKSRPLLAVQVFLWRLNQVDAGVKLCPEEYAKAISLAGRSKKVDFAGNLFADATRRGIRSISMYNSLMAAYMYNGLSSKAISVFEDLLRDPACKPSIVTYNILLSVYGRLMLIDKLENVLKQVHEQPELSPNLTTYNVLIASYLTAWMWERMENTYNGMMNHEHIMPDAFTHRLMLRGRAHAGSIEKMEEMYEIVKASASKCASQLVRAMICAYCKSSDKDRVSKIEGLLKLLPEDEYRPWLTVLLIRLYAQEGLLDAMERLIFEAIQTDVKVIALGVMRSIIASYFRRDSIDRLIKFVSLAECAGWKLCRSLFHCKMVMHGQRNQMLEMHGALEEMERFMFDRTKKTFLIMYKAYSKAGRRCEAKIIVGMMCKNGFLEPKAALLF